MATSPSPLLGAHNSLLLCQCLHSARTSETGSPNARRYSICGASLGVAPCHSKETTSAACARALIAMARIANTRGQRDTDDMPDQMLLHVSIAPIRPAKPEARRRHTVHRHSPRATGRPRLPAAAGKAIHALVEEACVATRCLRFSITSCPCHRRPCPL